MKNLNLFWGQPNLNRRQEDQRLMEVSLEASTVKVRIQESELFLFTNYKALTLL